MHLDLCAARFSSVSHGFGEQIPLSTVSESFVSGSLSFAVSASDTVSWESESSFPSVSEMSAVSESFVVPLSDPSIFSESFSSSLF